MLNILQFLKIDTVIITVQFQLQFHCTVRYCIIILKSCAIDLWSFVHTTEVSRLSVRFFGTLPNDIVEVTEIHLTKRNWRRILTHYYWALWKKRLITKRSIIETPNKTSRNNIENGSRRQVRVFFVTVSKENGLGISIPILTK